MARGFVYLTAVVDWFSRKVLSWRLAAGAGITPSEMWELTPFEVIRYARDQRAIHERDLLALAW
jgi:transposase InsO family protein